MCIVGNVNLKIINRGMNFFLVFFSAAQMPRNIKSAGEMLLRISASESCVLHTKQFMFANLELEILNLLIFGFYLFDCSSQLP